jgi:hypothetical protein
MEVINITFIGDEEKNNIIENMFNIECNNDKTSNNIYLVEKDISHIKSNSIFNKIFHKSNKILLKIVNSSILTFTNDKFKDYTISKMEISDVIFLVYDSSNINSINNVFDIYNYLYSYDRKTIIFIDISKLRNNERSILNTFIIKEKIDIIKNTSNNKIHHFVFNKNIYSFFIDLFNCDILEKIIQKKLK